MTDAERDSIRAEMRKFMTDNFTPEELDQLKAEYLANKDEIVKGLQEIAIRVGFGDLHGAQAIVDSVRPQDKLSTEPLDKPNDQ